MLQYFSHYISQRIQSPVLQETNKDGKDSGGLHLASYSAEAFAERDVQVVLEVVKREVSVWGWPSFGGNGVECSKKCGCKNRHSHGFAVLQAALPMRGQWFLAAHAATRRSCSPPVFCEQ